MTGDQVTGEQMTGNRVDGDGLPAGAAPEQAEEEFDTVAAWTADAIEQLPDVDPVPAACNGSGHPAALDWLADRMEVGPGCTVLDTGSGLGGPAEWVARRTGARLVTAEPMAAAAGRGHRLFGRPGVVAWSHQLPFANGTFDASMALAVLSTVTDKEAYLAEVRRVLAPGGRLGLLEYVRTGPVAEPPAGNEFLDPGGLARVVRAGGFRIRDEVRGEDLPEPPRSWKADADRVAAAVAAAHPVDRARTDAEREQDRFARLLEDGALRVRLLVAERAGGQA